MTASPNRVFQSVPNQFSLFSLCCQSLPPVRIPSVHTQHYTHSDKPCTRISGFYRKNVRRFLQLSPGMPIIRKFFTSSALDVRLRAKPLSPFDEPSRTRRKIHLPNPFFAPLRPFLRIRPYGIRHIRHLKPLQPRRKRAYNENVVFEYRLIASEKMDCWFLRRISFMRFHSSHPPPR